MFLLQVIIQQLETRLTRLRASHANSEEARRRCQHQSIGIHRTEQADRQHRSYNRAVQRQSKELVPVVRAMGVQFAADTVHDLFKRFPELSEAFRSSEPLSYLEVSSQPVSTHADPLSMLAPTSTGPS